MLKNKFEAKNYLKWLLLCDKNNSVAENFSFVFGYFPKTAYEIIYNDTFLEEIIEESKLEKDENYFISKEEIKTMIKTNLKNTIQYL